MDNVAALWQPSPERVAASRLGRWRRTLQDREVLPAGGGYDDLWEWSVTEPEGFWPAVAQELRLQWAKTPDRTLAEGPDGGVEGARWFPGGRLNYAALALHPPGVSGSDTAVMSRSQTRPPAQLTWDELRAEVARVAAGLAAAGVGPGDVVAGYLPNIPEALVALLAAASLGATWTCCAPETGVAGVLDRLEQVAPSALVTVDGYRWDTRTVDRRPEAEAVRAALPSVRVAVRVRYLTADTPPPGWIDWVELGTGDRPQEIADTPAEQPLHILYSSGTTGKPKAIVHGHAGIAMEHAKALAFHFDVGPGDRLYWYTTTGWMMWNFLVSGLLVGATVVLHDGAPAGMWEVVAGTRATCAGVGAAALVASERAGATPGRDHDLSALRTLGSTGSPLPASTAAWVYRAVAPDVALASFSGGTDVCTGFVGWSPLHPVWAGEISCRCLGAAVSVVDDTGSPVVGVEGELVLTRPLPSMPLRFWSDPDGARLHAAYYATFPRLWAHGDRATLTERGSIVISGRSDGTLNRGGVRMGTAEFYTVVEAVHGVSDSLVVHLEAPDELWLFVVTEPGTAGDELKGRIRDALRANLSPRHLPDHVVAIPAVPRTLSGKKLEVPVKRLLAGARLDEVVTLASVANPSAFDAILAARP